MEKLFKLVFSDGQQAKAIRIHRSDDLTDTLCELGFHRAKPTIVLVGGASGLKEDYIEKLRSLFTDVLAPLADNLNALVVDGGTDAGIMQLIGQAKHETCADFSLIGVAAIGTIIFPDQHLPPPEDGAPLEPNHSHFVLVPGELWGDEAPWIARVATILAQEQPSITILINGGKIAWQDVYNSVRANRPVLVIEGSGRTADELAAAIHGAKVSDRADELVNSGLLQAVDLADGLDHITCVLKQLMAISAVGVADG